MQRHFEQELELLRTNLIKMGSIVDEQVEHALDALLNGNVQLAIRVVKRDKKVDEYDNLIDSQCERIFALTQPVAIDLRLIIAALTINHELERIGDIAVNLAERTESLRGHSDLLRSTNISTMATHARQMVKDAIDAFVNNDAELARKICGEDDVVDEQNRAILGQLTARMKSDPALIEPAMHTLILSRHLERLADHATNIAEEVIFVVDAKIIKHHAGEPPPL